MLDLLDKLDYEYNRLSNLGRWIKKDDNRILALITSLNDMKTKYNTLQGNYSSLQALVASTSPNTPIQPQAQLQGKIPKPSPRKEGEPEVQEYEGRIWKWCNKCIGGTWNRTRVTSEHQPGKGKLKHHRQPLPTETSSTTPTVPSTQANIAETAVTPQANVANSSNFEMDFL
jgi:hypothetical protein